MDLEKRYLRVTRENYDEVAEKLEELGFVWGVWYGINPTQYNPFGKLALGSIKEFLLILNKNILFLNFEVDEDGNINHIDYAEIGYTELKVEELLAYEEHKFFYMKSVKVNNKDEEDKVLNILQQHKYMWNSDKLAKDIEPSENLSYPFYIHTNSNDKLMYSRYPNYDSMGTKLISIEELMTYDTTNRTPSTPAFKLVSKLEDLDEEDNGNGIYLSWDKKNKSLDVLYNGTTFCYWTENHAIDVWVGVLKSMGFKFEMKTKRTEKEIIAEMKSLAKSGVSKEDAVRLVEELNSL
ncbi:MAG: hypothetical protein ACRCX8_09940 [Sarcina sp.]